MYPWDFAVQRIGRGVRAHLYYADVQWWQRVYWSAHGRVAPRATHIVGSARSFFPVASLYLIAIFNAPDVADHGSALRPVGGAVKRVGQVGGQDRGLVHGKLLDGSSTVLL